MGCPGQACGRESRGVDRWHERVTEEHTLQRTERIDAVLAGSGDVAADAAEVHEGLEAAEGARNLLAQLHLPQIPFRLVVVEGHSEVALEGENVIGVVAEAVEQITGFTLLAAIAPFRAVRSSGRILRVAGLDDPLVPLEEPLLVGGRQADQAGRACRGHCLLDGQQVVDHGLRPLLRLLLPQEDQLE